LPLPPTQPAAQPPSPPSPAPWITVCVCSHERADYLRDCLDGLRLQTATGEFAVLVVDSGSSPAGARAMAAAVQGFAGTRLLRVDRPGLSLARNTAARGITTPYVAFLDDDAIPTPTWIAAIHAAIAAQAEPLAMLSGAIRPLWEAPLPAWWPADLRGVLSIVEVEGAGEYRQPGVAQTLEPIGANMILRVADLRAAGGFLETIGRDGATLLSDEEKVLAWRLQEAGRAVRYDSRIVVYHQIQAQRLTTGWLLARMYWQGVSKVRSARSLGGAAEIRREAVRRLLVLLLLAPVALIPGHWTCLIALRWRLAYALGFLRELPRRRVGAPAGDSLPAMALT